MRQSTRHRSIVVQAAPPPAPRAFVASVFVLGLTVSTFSVIEHTKRSARAFAAYVSRREWRNFRCYELRQRAIKGATR